MKDLNDYSEKLSKNIDSYGIEVLTSRGPRTLFFLIQKLMQEFPEGFYAFDATKYLKTKYGLKCTDGKFYYKMWKLGLLIDPRADQHGWTRRFYSVPQQMWIEAEKKFSDKILSDSFISKKPELEKICNKFNLILDGVLNHDIELKEYLKNALGMLLENQDIPFFKRKVAKKLLKLNTEISVGELFELSEELSMEKVAIRALNSLRARDIETYSDIKKYLGSTPNEVRRNIRKYRNVGQNSANLLIEHLKRAGFFEKVRKN